MHSCAPSLSALIGEQVIFYFHDLLLKKIYANNFFCKRFTVNLRFSGSTIKANRNKYTTKRVFSYDFIGWRSSDFSRWQSNQFGQISSFDHTNSRRRKSTFPSSQDTMLVFFEPMIIYQRNVLANTPKYGLLFHSSFIGRASAKNKGRVSRFLANKCTIASRIDCFSDVPVETFGLHLRQQVCVR